MKHPLIIGLLAVAPLVAAVGDIIKLKSGESLEGKIIVDRPDAIIVEVQVTPTIIDERTIPKSEIAAMDRVTPDESAFTELRDVVAPSTATSAAAYDELIAKKLQPFLNAHPSSPRVKDVQDKIAELEAEKKRITQGEVKLNDLWITADTYAAEKYQVDAAILLAEMQALQARNDLIGALNIFDQLEKKYPLSAAYPDAAEAAVKSAEALIPHIVQELSRLPIKKAERDRVIEQTPQTERATMRAAIERQEAQAKALVEQARKRGLRFYPPIADEGSLKELQRNLDDLLARVGKPSLDAAKQAVKAARDAERQIAENNLAAAEASVAAAENSWAQYEALNRLKARLDAAKKAAEAAQAIQAEVTVSEADAAKPTPTPTPESL